MKKRSFKSLGIFTIVIALVTMAFTKTDIGGKYFEISKNIEIFTSLYKELNTNYVNELDPSKLMRTGIEAMVTSLDPYTNYISEGDIEGYRLITEGKYNGVGATFDKFENDVMITEISDNSPAQKAGLSAGDVIQSVNNKTVKGKSVEEVGDLLHGTNGSVVELSVMRLQKDGSTKPQKIKITRGEITEQNVPYSGIVTNHIGYIVLTTFTREAGENVRKAFLDLKKKDPELKGVIFDLRNNGGGLLNEAVNICNVWIGRDNLVVNTRGKVADWNHAFKTTNPSDDEQIPIAVLVNKGSASASEIVSGTLQDYDRAVIIGQRSFGKGLVQNIYEIGYNAKVKITTSKYYIPSGRCIQAVRYENGKPIELPDSLSANFKTQNGRIVPDGGGIKPDIAIIDATNYGLIKELKEKFIIFNYVTEYVIKHDTTKSISDFRFTDYDDFLAFVKKKNFTYTNELETLVGKLKTEADKQKSDIASATEMAALEAKLKLEKATAFMKYKTEIVSQIEKEIIARWFYESGAAQINLRNDAEIKAALAILSDKARYNDILKKKE